MLEWRQSLTWFRPPESISLSNQSGIESCRGRFTELSRRPRRLPMQNNSKAQMRFGANHRQTQRKATYPALRHIGITCRMASAASISIRLSALLPVEEAHLTHGGILEPMASCQEQTPLERFSPQSRCQDSLTGSYKFLDGQSDD